jgi:hypothetical protein
MTRSGCSQCDCMIVGAIPDEARCDDRVNGSNLVHIGERLDLNTGLSGPFSWTKSACASAFFISVVKDSRSCDAPAEKPISVSAIHASSTCLRKLASAFGDGSVAITSSPRAKYCAAQLARITPAPIIAMRYWFVGSHNFVPTECFTLLPLSSFVVAAARPPRYSQRHSVSQSLTFQFLNLFCSECTALD